MGIRHLNRYFTKNCKKTSIEKKPLSILRDKFIVVDVSIYIYKYIAQNALQENMYQMITLFRKYNIKPLFIFDGKPPPEKLDTLQQRRLLKVDAETKYNSLNEDLSGIVDEELRNSTIQDMEQLKRQFVRVKERDINSIKEIMDAFGVNYYNANGEADKTCAAIQLNEKYNCYGCLSDDMDMFVYGCSRVIRHLSLINETVLIYNRDLILNDLNMTFPLFKQIAVLSGTDYNTNDNNNMCLFETLKWYNDFNNNNNSEYSCNYGFYEWLQNHTKYITNYDSLLEIHRMFDIDIIIDDVQMNVNKNYNKNRLQNIMRMYGFIFV